MDPQSFEKLDQEMMRSLGTVRRKRVPEEIRKNFRAAVEKRILESTRPGGFPLLFAAVPAVVLILGLALCWFYLRPAPRPLMPEPALARTVRSAMVPAAAPAPKAAAPVIEVAKPQPPAPEAQLSKITENNIVDEIEALKELGAWTDDDEQAIGIPSDQIFEELETLAGEFPQTAESMPV